MPPRSRLSIAKADIVAVFEQSEKRVYTRKEIDKILADNRQYWRLAQSTTCGKLIEFLVQNTQMALEKFELPFRPTERYLWGKVPTLEIVQSLRPDGYFTHFTALQLHGLTDQIPKMIYLNSEQRATGGGGALQQRLIDLAFKRKCRISNNTTTFREQTICILNGQNTGNLGVSEITTENGRVRVASIERTLIDIAVRPIYSGGPFEVARAYAASHSQFSVNKLVAYLKRMNFTYPYHQVIGYYLEKADQYTETQVSLLRQFQMDFDFYLNYAMKETDYVERWRLFVPKGF